MNQWVESMLGPLLTLFVWPNAVLFCFQETSQEVLRTLRTSFKIFNLLNLCNFKISELVRFSKGFL